MLAVKEGVEVAGIMVDESEGKLIQICFCVLMLIVTPIIFQGLLEFVIMVNNPFGDVSFKTEFLRTDCIVRDAWLP